jgi:hypothetical protein
MIKRFLSFLACLAFTISSPSLSARTSFGDDDAAFLIQACQKATEVFNARNEKRFLASQTTSLADALRAGYCLGALEQFQCSWGGHKEKPTFDTARKIAAMSETLSEHQNLQVDDFLQQEICD